MNMLQNKIVVVAGGTGNVGGFVVRGMLEQGATVVVPTRSDEKAENLKHYVSQHAETEAIERLHTVIGNVSDEVGGREVLDQIVHDVGAPDAVVALLGSWRGADSVLEAPDADFDHVLEHYLKAHRGVARTFLPGLTERGGTYVFVNGPLAFQVWPGGTGLVSIATAAQHMLFKVLVKEYEEHPVRIAELVTHAFIRNRKTQPGSPIPGEAVGAFAAHLVSDASGVIHGTSTHLQSMEQLDELGLSLPVLAGSEA